MSTFSSNGRIRSAFNSILLAILVIFPSAVEAAFVEGEIPRDDGSRIAYYLDRPEGSGSFPLVLFLQGSECRSVLGRPGMPGNPASIFRAGFLLIEKYGIRKENSSDEDTANCTPEFYQFNDLARRKRDALAVVASLKISLRGWNQELYLIGGSEGGMLAPLLAEALPETRAVAMLVAGNGRPVHQDMREALALTARKQGLPEPEIQSYLADFDRRMADIAAGTSPQEIYLGQTYRWWKSVLWEMPVRQMLKLDIPQLLIHGSLDSAVPVESARAAARAFRERRKRNLEYWELPGYDHGLVDASGKSHKMEYLARAMRWLLR